jgi:4-methylaminobutanoate oxidase (formaldehyde-forming)
MSGLPSHSEVVIIGGGVVGCSIAYHLAEKDIQVTLIERKSLTCGTTWHAAGLIGQLRATKNLIKMAKYSTNLYRALNEKDDLSAGFLINGSISIAENDSRVEEMSRGATMGRSFGLDIENISIDQIKKRYPLLDMKHVKGAWFLPQDGQINPVDITMCLAKEARRMGANIIEKNKVIAIEQNGNKVTKVVTEMGDIACDKIVISAGMWSREVGKLCGVSIPLHACEHFYAVTEYSNDIPKNLPVLRNPDAQIYVKEDAGKLLIGAFEKKAKPWGMNGIPEDFEFDSLPNDMDHFGPILMEAMDRLPILNDIGIKTYFNGPESFTPDDRYYLGKIPYKDNIFVSTGFNSIGIQSAGGVGKVMAEWISNDRNKMDLWDVDVSRVLDFQDDTEYLRERSSESLGLLYAVHWPFYQFETSRNKIQTTLYDQLKREGACFGEVAGWERANWFTSDNQKPEYEYSYGKQNWYENVKQECNAVRNDVGLFELSSFSKFIIQGKDTVKFLNYMCVSEMNVSVGKIIYTQMLNCDAGIESDVTFTRLNEENFMLVTSPTSHNKDYNWLIVHSKNYDVQIKDVTKEYGCLSIMGPNSREHLQKICNEDISNENLKFGFSKMLNINGAECILNRITYVGELGFEIYIPSDKTSEIFERLYAKNGSGSVKLAGYHALNSLRMEKGYLHWGHDIGIEENPFEAGVGFCVNFNKESPFLGQAALEKKKDSATKKRKINFALSNNDLFMYHNEPILFDGKIVGEITSGMYGFYLDKSLGMGYISASDSCSIEEMISLQKFEIEIAETKYKANGSIKCFYDPGRKKILI